MLTFAGQTFRAPPQIKSNEDLEAIDLRSAAVSHTTIITTATTSNNVEVKVDEGKALCRICYEVCDEKNRMNMGCSCKGEVGFIHEECAVKWFKLKGNKKCDVCDKEVSNSTIRSLPSPPLPTTPFGPQYSWLSVFLILTGVNTLIYFWFIMLMDWKWHPTTFIIVGASSFVMGILASLFAVLIGKECPALYAFTEFAFVALCFSELYSTIHLRLVYVIMISAASGFGITLVLNFISVKCYAWHVHSGV